jgi:GR25 family glycosyltransferase involved in LPS biosynthesis
MQIDLKNIKTICISLNTAIERRNNIKILMETLGYTNWSFFDAIKGKDIAEGCAKSHMEVLKQHDFSEPLLLIEDDVHNTQWYTDIVDYYDDFDALYIGYSSWAWNKKRALMSTFDHNTVAIKRDNFYKIERMLSAHAIIYFNKKYVDLAIDCIEKYLFNPLGNRHCDVALGNLQKTCNVYATPHALFYQKCAHNTLYTLCSIEKAFQEIEDFKNKGIEIKDLQ